MNNNLDKKVEEMSNLSGNHDIKGRIFSNEIDEAAHNDIFFDAPFSENSIQNKVDFTKIMDNQDMIDKLGYPESNNDTNNNAQFGTLFEQVEGELKKRGYENWDPSFITDIVTTINLGKKRKGKLEVKLPKRNLFRFSDSEMDTNLSINQKNWKKWEEITHKKKHWI